MKLLFFPIVILIGILLLLLWLCGEFHTVYVFVLVHVSTSTCMYMLCVYTHVQFCCLMLTFIFCNLFIFSFYFSTAEKKAIYNIQFFFSTLRCCSRVDFNIIFILMLLGNLILRLLKLREKKEEEFFILRDRFLATFLYSGS